MNGRRATWFSTDVIDLRYAEPVLTCGTIGIAYQDVLHGGTDAYIFYPDALPDSLGYMCTLDELDFS